MARSAQPLPVPAPPHLTLELNGPTSICHPHGFLEGLPVAKHPKIFPLELQFNSYADSSGGIYICVYIYIIYTYIYVYIYTHIYIGIRTHISIYDEKEHEHKYKD